MIRWPCPEWIAEEVDGDGSQGHKSRFSTVTNLLTGLMADFIFENFTSGSETHLL